MATRISVTGALAEFLSGGHFARHIRRTRDLFRQRQQDLLDLAPAITGGLLEVRPTPAGMLLGLLLGYAAYDREATRDALRVLAEVIRAHTGGAAVVDRLAVMR